MMCRPMEMCIATRYGYDHLLAIKGCRLWPLCGRCAGRSSGGVVVAHVDGEGKRVSGIAAVAGLRRLNDLSPFFEGGSQRG